MSPALSLFHRPGDGRIAGRRIAILVADGVDGEVASSLHAGLTEQAAAPRYLGVRLGRIVSEQGSEIEVEGTLETLPSVLFDAAVVLGGRAAVKALMNAGHAAEFLKDQYRHAKPILALGAAADLLEGAGIPLRLESGEPDPGLLVMKEATASDALVPFIRAIARHRHHERELDPPPV